MTMPLIIPIFIMHQGCPHRCSFCNQQKAAGPYPKDISEAFFRETVLAHLRHGKKKAGPVQIAFYGGNFTGMAAPDQTRLLEYAKPYLENGSVEAVRISTRPDCIDQEQLDRLKKYGVQIVEIGAQSLVDDVLKQANRGHGAKDVDDAVRLLKANGMQIGIHLMAGLPGDGPEGFAHSVRHTISLKPHMVRIHPTLVFAGTALAQDYRNGNYEPLSLDEAVSICKLALQQFAAAEIPVIRIGLQTTPEMEREGTVIAGPYHPAFRSLVESSLFFDRASTLLSQGDFLGKTVVFSVSPRDDSSFRGWRNENLRNLQKSFGLSGIRVSPAPTHPPGTLGVCIVE
jgi:histone acetyltransferase (RNA polymerase elongator complex component)